MRDLLVMAGLSVVTVCACGAYCWWYLSPVLA